MSNAYRLDDGSFSIILSFGFKEANGQLHASARKGPEITLYPRASPDIAMKRKILPLSNKQPVARH
jgi:hypothetical protein